MTRLSILTFIISVMGQSSCQTKTNQTKTDQTKNNQAKTEIERLDKGQLPKEISIQGNIISIQKWSDNLGVNYFILSATDEFVPQKAIDAKNDYVINDGDTIYSGAKDYRDKEIYMAHFITSDNLTRAVWKEEASVRDCAVDLELSFLEEYPRITDLDKDGISEIWTIYHEGCHGDVSPTEMKVIMTLNDKEYILDRRRIADIGQGRKVGGEIYSNTFEKNTPSFKIYADSLWDKFKNWN